MSIELQRAIDLITDRSRWTTGVAARDVNGAAAEPDDPAAVCWCGQGAMAKEKVSRTLQRWVSVYCRAVFPPSGGLTCTNDGPDGRALIIEAMQAVLDGWIPEIYR